MYILFPHKYHPCTDDNKNDSDDSDYIPLPLAIDIKSHHHIIIITICNICNCIVPSLTSTLFELNWIDWNKKKENNSSDLCEFVIRSGQGIIDKLAWIQIESKLTQFEISNMG